MNLVRYIENRHQELTLEAKKADAFNIRVDSEMKASHDVLTFYRWVSKWFLVPKVFYGWLLVNLKLRPEPVPVILNLMKEEQAKKAAASAENVVSITQG